MVLYEGASYFYKEKVSYISNSFESSILLLFFVKLGKILSEWSFFVAKTNEVNLSFLYYFWSILISEYELVSR